MKKLLLAACAAISVVGLQARYIEIDNDTDGKQATTVQAMVYFANNPSQKIMVSADKERKVRFSNDMQPVSVYVKGTQGAGRGQVARYHIPPRLKGKNIKVDVDLKNGRLQLSHDRR